VRQFGRLLALVIVLAALSYGVIFLWLGPNVPVHVVARSTLLQSVVASGRVETPLRVDIGSQITAAVADIPVLEGQSVKAGQLLIALSDSEAQAALDQALAAVAQAQAHLTQLQEVALPLAQQALRQADVNLDTVRRQHARTQQLQASGFVGQAQFDDARRNLALADSAQQAARLQVAANLARGSDRLAAQAALDQAQANWRIARARLGYALIRAPLDGTLIARNVERGDVVQPGKALMVLSPLGPTQLVVQIDEKNLGLLRLGQAAIGSADAYPQQRFDAELVYINPSIDPQRGSVAVKFNVLAAPAYLRQDMTVSVDIEVARRLDALAVPFDVVHDGAGEAPWVMKIDAGRAMRQGVKLGLRGAGMVEIVHGLQAGDVLIAGAAGAAGAISPGRRVRARITPAARSWPHGERKAQ
jgi:HlyD family secretion protein